MNHSSNNNMSSCASFGGASPDLSSFAYSLFSALTTSNYEANVLISPFSIASALALALAGATIDSICQAQLLSSLGIKNHSDVPLLSNTLLSSSSSKQASGVELSIANGIWTKESIKASYKEVVTKQHGSIASVLTNTYDPINEYVSEKTGGMIKDLMQGPVNPLTVAVLVNAVFFKGTWKQKFDTEETVNGTFYSLNPYNKVISREAMMMKSTRHIHFGIKIKSLGGANGALLEYGGTDDKQNANEESQEFGALFLMPNQNNHKSMETMISKLVTLMSTNDAEAMSPLEHLLQNDMRKAKVDLIIPRFKVTYGVQELKPTLQSVGIIEAFNPDGKELFNEMTDDPLVYLDEVYHKAVMEVTEEGTVAAAATAAVMMTRSLPRPPPELRFDRPFVMIVLHLETGLPLFMGRIDDPELMF